MSLCSEREKLAKDPATKIPLKVRGQKERIFMGIRYQLGVAYCGKDEKGLPKYKIMKLYGDGSKRFVQLSELTDEEIKFISKVYKEHRKTLERA